MPSLAASEEEEPETNGLFVEPAGYYAPEKPPTTTDFILNDNRRLYLRLVGHNPLWGHHLWNGGRELAAYLQEPISQALIRDASILELGAGAGLPSLVAALMGAKRVVVTDYPDRDLIENIRHNIRHASSTDLSAQMEGIGYRWGDSESAAQLCPVGGFNVILLADLNFNHSEHEALASTLVQLLSRADADAQALVFFTPYRPWLLEKDREFFRLAVEQGFLVQKVRERKFEKVMFEKDPGDEALRRTVYGYAIRWPRENEKAGWIDEM